MAREQDQQAIATNINRLCQGSEVSGDINTSSDIRLDGALTGNIISKGKVVIGNTGKTKGDTTCRIADIFGQVEGNLNVSEFITIKSTAVVKGNIFTKKINIEAGAVFNGTCSISNEKSA
jgi:Integral membrane protein CcmA involved in cell shape determination